MVSSVRMAQFKTERQEYCFEIRVYFFIRYAKFVRFVFIVAESIRITDFWNLTLYNLGYLCYNS
jgi:hypothetical protein